MAMTPIRFTVQKVALLTAAALLVHCGGDDNAAGTGGEGGTDAGRDSSAGAGGTGGSGGGGGTGVIDGATPREASADSTGGSDATTPVDANVTPAVQVLLDGATIPKYVDALPTFSGRRASAAALTVDMVEFQQKILPASVYASADDPYKAGTYLWGYDVNASGPSWPSTTIEVQKGTAATVTYANKLQGPNGSAPVLARFLTTDLSIHWADPTHITHDNGCVNGPPLAGPCLASSFGGPVPAVVHLHGAEVLSDFDGHPDTWFTPGNLLKGPAYKSNVYTYPNGQEATALWFHDHALGRTRLNVYSGLAGFYLIRDPRDTGLANNPMGLPAGPYETELMIADRQFDTNGQLFFPNGLPGNPVGINGPPPNPDHHPFWNPEFFGDVITVNGKSWPYMDVQPRRYRFRIVNASNARMYRMQLVETRGFDTTPSDAGGEGGIRDGGLDGGGPLATPPPIWQIGSDGGFLNAPVRLNVAGADPDDPAAPLLFVAPAERMDVIIDFGAVAGRTFTLINDAVAPFPSGDPPNPDTNGQIMQFRVAATLDGGADTSYNPALSPDAGGVALRTAPIVDIKATVPNKKRQLVLVEVEGPGGPEEVLLNNSGWAGFRAGATTPTVIPGSVPNGSGINSTENPQIGSTEVWEIANLTEDAHPIHVHLIQFQVINRQALVSGVGDVPTDYRIAWDALFPGGSYIPGYGPPLDYATPNADGALGGNLAFGDRPDASTGFLDGAPVLPAPNERGWKDTIRMLPRTVTRVALRWAPQGTAVGGVAAGTNLFSFDPGAAGPGYAWHCHILDHEDNEMMRPYLVAR